MESLIPALNAIDSFMWGPPLISLLVGTGIFLTIRLHMLQVFRLPKALKLIFSAKNNGEGDVSSFKALCVALAATVGTGNIVGVATAVKVGGPGAIFWMWMAAFFGMATKYAEGLLAVKYRSVDEKGEIAGGPMFYIRNGMGEKYKPLATFFAIAAILVAYLGIGTFPQVNAIVDSVELSFGISKMATDIILTILIAAITLGGLQSIAKVSSKVIPFMAVLYIVICLGLIIMNLDAIPAAVSLILESAFTGTAAAGGFAGSTIMMAMQNGIARGVFSNESGLGSAPIAAAAAKTKYPAEQGLISMTGTFIDTIIICTMTGLALVLTGAWQGDAAGAAMTNAAFHQRLRCHRQPAPDGFPRALRLHDNPRLELLWRARLHLPDRYQRRHALPDHLHPADRFRCLPEARSHLDPGRYRQWPHGHPEPYRPHRTLRRSRS
jgi:AGCS family alanine or glycine:cation symporter